VNEKKKQKREPSTNEQSKRKREKGKRSFEEKNIIKEIKEEKTVEQ